MKNIKSIIVMVGLSLVALSSCKKNKDKDNDGSEPIKKYVPVEMQIRESGTTNQLTYNFSYNSKRQLTTMRYDRDTSYGIYNLFYLDNDNLDYYTQEFNSSPLATNSIKYDGGQRPIEIAYNGTPEVTISHTTSGNIYTVDIIGSSYLIDIDFDDKDNLQAYYSGTDSIVIDYLPNQRGVFAYVALNPSVIIPFHIFPYGYELYYLHANQINEVKGFSPSNYLYSDQQRDDNGNLSSFRMRSGAENLIFTIRYELK